MAGDAQAAAEYRPTIKELPSSERPRERLENYGPGALSTGVSGTQPAASHAALRPSPVTSKSSTLGILNSTGVTSSPRALARYRRRTVWPST